MWLHLKLEKALPPSMHKILKHLVIDCSAEREKKRPFSAFFKFPAFLRMLLQPNATKI